MAICRLASSPGALPHLDPRMGKSAAFACNAGIVICDHVLTRTLVDPPQQITSQVKLEVFVVSSLLKYPPANA
ncbi:hypothetical protein J1614_011905 [Plenodomus biglobosus]|nr:hypothetical protein J1614_011905 [Plenodomus biglobosus]